MITQNELYDLGFVIKLIRSEIDDPNNVAVLELILLMFENPDQLIENNQIRKTLCQISQLSEKWEFVRHENYYVRTLIFKDRTIQTELYVALTNLKLLLQSKKYEQAFDLADALHALPEIIVDNGGKVPDSYRKTFIIPYQKKWKCNV